MIDAELNDLLVGVAALSLEGAKGVGESATAAERVDAEFHLESPNGSSARGSRSRPDT